MAVDPLSPIAPARIRALVLPVGRIKRSRFMSFRDRLAAEHVVRLGDVSPDLRSDRTMFSPLAFPSGMLLYDFSTSVPSSSQIALSPFEIFREPQLVIGIADGAEHASLADSIASDIHGDANMSVPPGQDEELESAIKDLRERHKKALVHAMMIFDCPVTANRSLLPQGTIPVPPVEQSKTTTMKTIVCDLTSLLLAELTTLAKSIEALPTIVAFSASRSDVDEAISWQSKPTLVRSNSQPSTTSRSGSPGMATFSGQHRSSVHGRLPSSRSNTPTLADDSRPDSPAEVSQSPSVKTFDDVGSPDSLSSYGMTADSKPRPAVRDGSRASSRDRISFHGSSSINERIRNKGKGRVGIVIGSIYMQAGRWHDALRELVENTARARAFSDHIWHAKGLENIMICLILFAWVGIDFKIPQICYPIAEKAAIKSPQHTPSNSVVDVSQQPGQDSNTVAGLRSLTTLAPDLVNMILSVYTRPAHSTGDSLPQLAFSECTIRLAKLLSTINLAGGTLHYDALQHLVRGTSFAVHPSLSVPRLTISPTRTEIASLLFRALPPPTDDLAMLPVDAVMVIAHIASVLSSLGMQRKKAMIVRGFLAALIPGLVQARRVGAAEAGVHPAAGLTAISVANGISGGSLRAGTTEAESGLNSFLALLGETYGIPRLRGSYADEDTQRRVRRKGTADQPPEPHDLSDIGQPLSERLVNTILQRSFGSLHLKLDILRTCIAFCEALPDFQGVLDSTAALLATAGPGVAPRANSTAVYVSLAKEEQLRLAAVMVRTMAAAKRLGTQNIETDY